MTSVCPLKDGKRDVGERYGWKGGLDPDLEEPKVILKSLEF